VAGSRPAIWAIATATGFYFVTGRLKELIIKGGENIAPREIDEALLKHPAVLEAAAVGIPDREYGQEILACVVLKAGRRVLGGRAARHCLTELWSLQDPETVPLCRGTAQGTVGQGAALEAGRQHRLALRRAIAFRLAVSSKHCADRCGPLRRR
jgi:acyl-CoA synthetase (AMP-forming)/AMP-acid ligase II